MKRRLKLATVTLAMAVVIGTTASSAQALEWIVEGKPLELNKHRSVSCVQGGSLKIASTIAGAAATLEFGKAECKEWEIWNAEGKTETEAFSLGRLKLTEGIVVGKAGCKFKEGTLTTASLTGRAEIFSLLKSHTGVTYKPATGSQVAPFVIEAVTGQKCPLAGSYSLNGTTVAEIPEVNKLVENPVEFIFSKTVEEGVSDALTLGVNPATFSGILKFTI